MSVTIMRTTSKLLRAFLVFVCKTNVKSRLRLIFDDTLTRENIHTDGTDGKPVLDLTKCQQQIVIHQRSEFLENVHRQLDRLEQRVRTSTHLLLCVYIIMYVRLVIWTFS